MSHRTMKTLLVTALMVFGLAGPAAAQSAAVVVGSIVDQTGAPLAGARVTIRGVAVRMAATGAAGDFAFSDVPNGDYEMSAELSGFERARREVRVLAGERVTVSLALRVAILAETIVTAAKAGERDLQSVPMAVSAVSSAEIARLGTQTVSDTPALAPSVTFSQNTGWGQLTIRGIGASTLLAGSDPSSAMYLDGVYLARPSMAGAQFLDLERIEVLRGLRHGDLRDPTHRPLADFLDPRVSSLLSAPCGDRKDTHASRGCGHIMDGKPHRALCVIISTWPTPRRSSPRLHCASV
jgi:outer membrane receptor protein involved in Fe transport